MTRGDYGHNKSSTPIQTPYVDDMLFLIIEIGEGP